MSVSGRLNHQRCFSITRSRIRRSIIRQLLPCGLLTAALLLGLRSAAREKSTEAFGEGLSVSVPAPEQQLLEAVEDVAGNGIIEGTKEYNKDQYITGAEAVDSTQVFPQWTGGGRVFYKIKNNALDPRNFKDTNDTGTLAVRYIVQHGDEKNALLKINAIFVDDFHHRDHPSNGSVEGAEYKEIQDHLAAMQLKKKQAADEEQHHQQQLAAQELERQRKQQQLAVMIARPPNESAEQHVAKLRREVERIVKPSGAQLKSAPFKSASSLQSIPAGAHVAILISTPYWYGVETEDGQHGWIHRSQLEQLP